MNIPGTFFTIKLLLNDVLIEMQLLRRQQIVYQASIMEFSEVEYDLVDVLADENIFLPKNRLQLIMEKLEAEYLELKEKQHSILIKHQGSQLEKMKDLSGITNFEGKTQKILLMGGTQGSGRAGKTSIYEVIFKNKLPYETQGLERTGKVEEHEIEFPSLDSRRQGQKVKILDIGSSISEPDKEWFSNASVLIFVVDAFDVENYESISRQLHQSVKAMEKWGTRPDFLRHDQNNIFCFIHKIDRLPKLQEQYDHLVEFFKKDPDTGEYCFNITFFPTSIFDSSIYSAWTSVIETMMPKSKKLNRLATNLKEDLKLYAALIIERRTGLPICASKTLLDDAALVGNTNRLIITMEKVLPEYQLTGLQSFHINTATGILEIRIFAQYFILVMLYPNHVDLKLQSAKLLLREFIEIMEKEI